MKTSFYSKMSDIEQPVQTISKQSQSRGRDILHRLDQLQFSRWHFFMVLSLGLVWVFDGYQVSLISLFRKYIVDENDQSTFKSLATSYQVGCIIGSFIFGIMGFTVGRRRIFLITLIIYAVGIIFSIVSKSTVLFMLGRLLTGISIGGEFTAIFTAIDEFLPPKYRGRVNIGIDGTWHLGGSLAAVLNIVMGEVEDWRYMFSIGLFGVLSLLIMRRNIPESPRWLILNRKYVEADGVVRAIEGAVANNRAFLQLATDQAEFQKQHMQSQLVSQRSSEMQGKINLPISQRQLPTHPTRTPTLAAIILSITRTMLTTIKNYKSRFLLAFFLMFTQAFFFNLIYYKFPAILQHKYHLTQQDIALYMLPLSISSFVSTLVVGPLFDKIGRRQLLLVTYACSGVLLIVSQLIDELLWLEGFICFMFFFTSPAGSSANLIASQIFPTSSRTLILFFMFMVGMVGGIMGVWIDTVWVGSVFMIVAGMMGYVLCPRSENKSLQQIEKM